MLTRFSEQIKSAAEDTDGYLNDLIGANINKREFMICPPGYKRIMLLEFAIAVNDIPELQDIISEWIQSDEGAWVIGNVSNIKVVGAYDAALDSGRFFISSILSDQEVIEYSLRWQ